MRLFKPRHNNMVIAGLIGNVMMIVGANAAWAADQPASAQAEPQQDARAKLAIVHEQMASCLRSDMPISHCRARMMTRCQDAMGKSGCSMMGMNSAPQAVNQRAPAGSDSDVATRVKKALHSDAYLYDKHVDVAVESGNVVLNGFVEDNRQLLDAADIATATAGDRKIINRLSIKQDYPN